MSEERYARALERLRALGRLGIHAGLDEMAEALRALGSPELKFPSLHVAGTNGKGSTSAIAAAVLGAAGLRVGLYTSPHLVRFTERIRIDGVEITRDEAADLCDEVLTLPVQLSFFEAVTAMAFLAFARARVDVAVIEVGLGGRLDATTLCAPFATVITGIGLDHTELLGATVGLIALEKAGIIKRGIPLVTGPLLDEAEAPIARVAAERGAPRLAWGRELEASLVDGKLDYRGPGGALTGAELALAGPHQAVNAGLALCATSLFVRAPDDQARRLGLSSVRWPGRLERWGGVLLDGAHNEEGARALAAALASLGIEHPVLLVGVLADKDARAILGPLAPLASVIVCTAPPSPRALPARDLASLGHELAPATPLATADDPADALALAQAFSNGGRRTIVAFGSLFLVGALRAILSGEPRDSVAVSDPGPPRTV